MEQVMPGSLKAWLLLPRFHFILLSMINVSLGSAIAARDGYFSWTAFGLAITGAILVHITVNVINDYYDYRDGIDLQTQRTPFSGGSGVLPAHLLRPAQAFWFATVCLLLAAAIGIFFVFTRGWLLLPLLLIAGFSAYFYNVFLAKWMMGELFAGFNLGVLLVLGSYFVQAGTYSWEAFIASLAPGLLTSNLLFLNEFPDSEADRKGGRRHLVISLGKRNASYCFVILLGASYACILAGVATGIMPLITLIGLGTIGWGWKTVKGVLKSFNDQKGLVPVMGTNVVTILGTQGLLTIGYMINAMQ